MALAKKATLDDVNLKIMIWGESGSGKSRFSVVQGYMQMNLIFGKQK